MTARGSKAKRRRWPPSEARLDALIEVAIIDAYSESDQRIGFYTMLEDNLRMPFDVEIPGSTVTVEHVDMTDNDEIVVICRRGRARQAIPVLELPLPDPPPHGAEWIEAYRAWGG